MDRQVRLQVSRRQRRPPVGGPPVGPIAGHARQPDNGRWRPYEPAPRCQDKAQATRQIFEAGDIDEALNAATQIGDDILQRKARGTVQPETFTHGTSAQRVHWFKQGFETGQIEQCDTFKVQQL